MPVIPSFGSDNSVSVLIRTVADDGAIKTTQAEILGLGEASKKASDASVASFDKFNKSLGTLGSEMTKVGTTLTTHLSLPIIGIGAEAVKSAMDFQQAMTYIRTDAGDTTDDIGKLSNQVLALAKNSQFSPDQLVDGLYHLASLGLRGADAMNALNTAQQMAAVGGADLESTASALGGALVTGIKGVQDYSSAAGVLDATIGAGNMRMQDLVNAIGTGVLPVFKNAGLNIVDFGAALATLTDNAQDASAAATHLRMTIALMQAPSGPARQALQSIGLAANQLGMDMQTKGLIPALQDLQDHLIKTYGTTAEGKQKIAAALDEMFGGGRSSAAIQVLLSQLERVQQKEQQIGEQSGEFAGKYAEQQQTAAAQFKTAWNSVQVSLIDLGNVLIPVVSKDMTSLAHSLGNLTTWFDHLSPKQKDMLIHTAEIAVVVGPATLALGTFAKSLSSIFTLTSTLSKGFGALSGGMRVLGGLGGAAEGIGGIGIAGEAVAGGGLLAALGPLAIGLGAVGLASFGAYKYMESFKQAANDDEGATRGLYGAVSFLSLQQGDVKSKTDAVTKATNNLRQAQQTQKDEANLTKTAQQGVADAQQKVNDALTKYGQNSPQYISATQDLTDKETALNVQLLQNWSNAVSVKTAEDNLVIAHSNLANSTADLTRLQNILNKGLDESVNTIAKFGPTALDQVQPVATLQTNLTGVVTTFSNFSGILQSQLPNQAALLQGLGSTIDRLQTQSSTLNGSLQHAGVSLQNGKVVIQGGHASGSNFTRAGWSMVGENGPEAVYLPEGAMVKTAPQTGSAKTGTGDKGVTIIQTNHVYNQMDMTEANRELSWRLANGAIA